MASSRVRGEAEARYAKAQKRASDASKAFSEVQAEARRVEEKTARLRALRLAREEADRKEAAAADAAPKKKARKRTAK